MIDEPLVSVCIPVFNGMPYLKDAIESVLNQTYGNIELIIVDNFSTDGSYELSKSYEKDGVLVYRNSHNIGQIGNWNECLLKSTGELIKLLPADDFLYSDAIAAQVNSFIGSDIALTSSSRDIIDEHGKLLFNRTHKEMSKRNFSYQDIVKLAFKRATNVIGEPGAVMFKRAAALNAGFFDQNYGFTTDFEYWLRLSKFGNLFFSQKPLVVFRLNSNSESVALIKRQASDNIMLFKNLFEKVDFINKFTYIKACVVAYLNAFARFIFYKIYL
jgi:glycosyltransferase involved in cell wall biosynthesis